MDQTLFLWLSVVIIFSLGTLAHFLYDLSHENKILGLFTAVNESTWEHVKIAITPTLLWSLIDGFFYGEDPNYFTAKLTSLTILAFFAIINLPDFPFISSYLSAIGTFIFFGAYMTLTLMPLKQIIFKDPTNGQYGFRAHRIFFKSLKKKSHKKYKKQTKKKRISNNENFIKKKIKI